MPVAVIEEETKHYDLKTLPEGFVVVKRMTYGQKLVRSEMAMKMRVKGEGRKQSDFATEIDMMNRKIALWSFANLIADHNLTDKNGQALNFKNPADVERIAGKVGEEIEAYIDELNNFEAEAADSGSDLGN